MFFYLSTGIILGLSSGLSPGPLLALVISLSLNEGKKAGIKAAISPLITDIPIIILSFVFLEFFINNNVLYGILSAFGGGYILYLSLENFKAKKPEQSELKNPSGALKKGVIANFLNPAPYIFWIAIGTPTLIKGADSGIVNPVLFLSGFYICLVGSKIILAILLSKTKGKVDQRLFRIVNILLGIFMVALAGKFFFDSYTYLTGS